MFSQVFEDEATFLVYFCILINSLTDFLSCQTCSVMSYRCQNNHLIHYAESIRLHWVNLFQAKFFLVWHIQVLLMELLKFMQTPHMLVIHLLWEDVGVVVTCKLL